MFLLSGIFCCWGCSFDFFCCLGGGSVFFFGFFGVNVFICLLHGRERVYLFAAWAGGRVVLFAVWPGGVLFFVLLFGRGACCCFTVWAGDGSSLTYRSAWLVFKGPNNKKDQTAKKKTRVHTGHVSAAPGNTT